MIFTDDECRRIYNDAMELPGRTTLVVMRAIEAAILAKLRKGEIGVWACAAHSKPVEDDLVNLVGILQKANTKEQP